MKIFAPRASLWFGKAIARHLRTHLSSLEEREFADGEHKVRPLEPVQGEDVYVVQSLYGESQASVHDKLCRMLFAIAALKDAGAARLTAVVPYLCYARKDRRTKSLDPVTTRYVAQLIESVGTDRILTLEVHNPAAFENAFRIPAITLDSTCLWEAELIRLGRSSKVAVVSPDIGGVKRAERLRSRIASQLEHGITLAFLEKYRSSDVVSGAALIGDVADSEVVLVDDLISTGTTLARAATTCLQAGAVRVTAMAAHGVLVGNAAEVLRDSRLASVMLSNTVAPLPADEDVILGKIIWHDAAPLFADKIGQLAGASSMLESALV